jgi:RecB family exonuclease
VLLWAAATAWAGSGPINANGTWRADDGTSSGKWMARFEIASTGALSGSITLTGMGNDTSAEIEGTVAGNQIKFGLAATYADTPADKQPVCTFEGTIRGVRVTGTFSDSQGREGQWQGWWKSGSGKAQSREDPAGATVVFGR